MQLFSCESCGQMVYFENVRCERCSHALGYLARENRMLSLTGAGDDTWQSADGARFRYCDNARFDACNWLLADTEPTDTPQSLCEACALNRTIPDVANADHRQRWIRLELAKHRMIYSLFRLGLPVQSGHERPGGLLFDFLAGPESNGKESAPVVTGHADGLITVDLAEADSAVRVQRRQQLGERFRTLLGHFRHEIGHFYWAYLTSGDLDAFRRLFGDETRDYDAALEEYYRAGVRADWNSSFVSPYASSHPFEDWAETFAHYLHIVDTLDSARAFGVGLQPPDARDDDGTRNRTLVEITVDSYTEPDFDRLSDAWLPLTFAVNALNRSMGNDDLYPFVLTPAVLDKLKFVNAKVRSVNRAR